MMQAFLVVPGFALVYLIAAPTSLRKRRIVDRCSPVWRHDRRGRLVGRRRDAVAGRLAARTSVARSTTRILELIFGYNGFGRLTGNETGSVGGGGGHWRRTGMWGATGITRLFGSDMGGQISWLIPAALIFLVGGLVADPARAAHRPRRAGTGMLWGSWLLVTGLTFSYAQGIIHPYYTVALAPAIGALVGMGAMTFWRHRESLGARLTLSAAIAATACWSYVLLQRNTGTWQTLGAADPGRRPCRGRGPCIPAVAGPARR